MAGPRITRRSHSPSDLSHHLHGFRIPACRDAGSFSIRLSVSWPWRVCAGLDHEESRFADPSCFVSLVLFVVRTRLRVGDDRSGIVPQGPSLKPGVESYRSLPIPTRRASEGLSIVPPGLASTSLRVGLVSMAVDPRWRVGLVSMADAVWLPNPQAADTDSATIEANLPAT